MNAKVEIDETCARAVPAPEDLPKPELPVFKRRWWFRDDLLDARPVAWSLYNRPQDWRIGGDYTIVHTPSSHEFWVGGGRGFYGLWCADCPCSSSRRKFQRFQQGVFHRAYRHWVRGRRAKVDADQFAAHFVR